MSVRAAILALFASTAACALEGPPLDRVWGDAGPPDATRPSDAATDAATDAEPVCPSGLLRCGDVCVDALNNPIHCGACDRRCPSSLACVAGACTCLTPFMRCGDACVDPASSGSSCGACDNPCRPGQVCSRGNCQPNCGPGQTPCGSSCVTLVTDHDNCGACGRACLPGQVCAGSSCGCPRDLIDCDGACVDGRTDPAHCGACGQRCDAAHAVSYCAAGACGFACLAGYADCDGDAANGCEVDVRLSLDHCGVCGNRCASGANCVLGVCTCQMGATACGGRCTDTLTDPANCGTCGRVCSLGFPCHSGKCLQAP